VENRDHSSMEIGVSYSTICEKELISKLVPLYELSKAQTCRFWERGVNDTYKLVCTDNTYSLRVYRHELRTLDAIEFEVAALNHLHKRGLHVANPIARKDGQYITKLQAPEGVRYAMVTAYAHGTTLNHRNHANAAMYGQAVAQLHNLSDDFVTDYHRPRLDVEYLLNTSLDIISAFLVKESDDLEYLDKTATDLRQKIASVPVENLDFGFCHGDCHGGNVHKNNGNLTHYDFDCCGLGLRVFDLATFKWGLAGNKGSEELWDAFFTAYRGSREVGETDSDLIDTFVAIRHIWWIALRCGNAHDFGNSDSGELFVLRQIRNLKSFFESELENAASATTPPTHPVIDAIKNDDKLDSTQPIFVEAIKNNEVINEAFNQTVVLNRITLAEYLIAHGADVGSVSINQLSLFEVALHHDRIDYLGMLFNTLRNTVNIHDRKSTVLPLLVSKLKDHPNVIDRIKILLEQGANINAQTNEGDTAVILAGWETDNLELVRFLVEQGADVNIPNNNGDTPVIDAADLGKIEILEYLLENGADINIKNKAGRSASNMAANSDVMKVLAHHDK